MVCPAPPSSWTASISFHPGNYASQLRMGYNDPTIYVRDLNGSVNGTSALSGELVDTSSARYKQNIASWPGRSLSAAAPDVMATIKALRPVKFQYNESSALAQTMPRRSPRRSISATRKAASVGSLWRWMRRTTRRS